MISPRPALLVLLLLWAVPAGAFDFYTWTDDEGVTHFANSLEDVPERYRDQIETMDTGVAESAPAAVAPDPGTAPANPPAPRGRFEIPYQAYEGSARRVIIPVTFNDRITAPMALDTGSPGMVISIDLAERLGLFSRGQGVMFTEVAGIGGNQLAIKTIVDSVAVDSARQAFVPTTVTTGISDAFEGLIGMDFLSNHTISIDSSRQVLVFQETPPAGDTRGGHGETWWRNTFREFREARDYWKSVAEAEDSRFGTRAGEFVQFQARESQRLLLRLDRYASQHAVPRHWR